MKPCMTTIISPALSPRPPPGAARLVTLGLKTWVEYKNAAALSLESKNEWCQLPYEPSIFDRPLRSCRSSIFRIYNMSVEVKTSRRNTAASLRSTTSTSRWSQASWSPARTLRLRQNHLLRTIAGWNSPIRATRKSSFMARMSPPFRQ